MPPQGSTHGATGPTPRQGPGRTVGTGVSGALPTFETCARNPAHIIKIPATPRAPVDTQRCRVNSPSSDEQNPSSDYPRAAASFEGDYTLTKGIMSENLMMEARPLASSFRKCGPLRSLFGGRSMVLAVAANSLCRNHGKCTMHASESSISEIPG
jgi:hypothetical protein